MERPDALRPRWNFSKILMAAISVFVFALALAFLVVGMLLVPAGLIQLVLGAGLIGLAFLARPRWNRLPKGAIERNSAPPNVRALADQIAAQVGTRPADYFGFNSAFNAWVEEVGWNRRRLVTIGVPMMAVMSPQERISILGHEFGHFVNGDPRRGLVTSTALITLYEWFRALVPRSLMDVEDEGLPGLMMLPVNLFMFALASLPYGLLLSLITLDARDSQRGEYLADARAAEIAGSANFISANDKLNLARPVLAAMNWDTDEHWLNRNLWDELSSLPATFPAREWERYRRIDRERNGRVDDTHPPTMSRDRVVKARQQMPGSLVPTDAQNAAVDAELRQLMTAMQRDIIGSRGDRLGV
jgi:Zn-dependent protease with chaperone function